MFMSAEQFTGWLKENNLTDRDAACQFCVPEKLIKTYKTGIAQIPLTLVKKIRVYNEEKLSLG